MTRPNMADHEVWGGLILERLDAIPLPAALKPFVARFRLEHTKLGAAADAADAMRDARDLALEELGSADAALDASIEKLADALVGAGLADRTRPFAKFSRVTPSDLTKLAYANEAKEARALVKRIKAKKPTGDLAKALAACGKAIDGVERALKATAVPQAKYAKALAARDAELLAWNKALSILKKHAAAVWDEEDATVRAIFAHPTRIQRPRAHRGPVKANGAPSPEPPQPEAG